LQYLKDKEKVRKIRELKGLDFKGFGNISVVFGEKVDELIEQLKDED
jgi:hypothetical protein